MEKPENPFKEDFKPEENFKEEIFINPKPIKEEYFDKEAEARRQEKERLIAQLDQEIEEKKREKERLLQELKMGILN